jgi:hypothetical protein
VCGELTSDDFVVRYGRNTCTPEALESTATAHHRKHLRSGRDEYGVSVNVGEGKSPEEIASLGQRPNSQFRYCTVGDVLAANCTISDHVDEYGHTNVVLPNPPDENDYIRLSECFQVIGNNPKPTPLDQRTRP